MPQICYSCPKAGCPSYGLKNFGRRQFEDHVHKCHGGPEGRQAATMDNWEACMEFVERQDEYQNRGCLNRQTRRETPRRVIWRCSRSGPKPPARKLKRKAPQSKKINGNCPFYMEVNEFSNGKAEIVTYCYHLGHGEEDDEAPHRLFRPRKRKVVDKVKIEMLEDGHTSAPLHVVGTLNGSIERFPVISHADRTDLFLDVHDLRHLSSVDVADSRPIEPKGEPTGDHQGYCRPAVKKHQPWVVPPNIPEGPKRSALEYFYESLNLLSDEEAIELILECGAKARETA